MEYDISIEGRGFYSIRAKSEAAREWMINNVPDCDLDGVAYCDVTQYTQDIADGAFADGLTVLINNREYLGNGRCSLNEVQP